MPSGGDISTNITRGSPHPAHDGARPRAPFTSVKPNIYACNRLRCGSIDLVRPHLSQYRTHIQHTRAIQYSYLSAVVPPSSAAALLSPAARFTGVDPNIYECNRIKCGSIDLARAHLSRYRTHIQHTCAIQYSYLSAVVPAPSSAAALLSPARRGSQILARTCAAREPKCPCRLLVRANVLVPPVYPQYAFIRAARYRQTSLADRHVQDTASPNTPALEHALRPSYCCFRPCKF